MTAPRSCVILQPSFAPWRGVFKLIRESTVFVFYDDVQYDKHGWRNRNRILVSGKWHWLTVPVRSAGGVRLDRTEIDWSGRWSSKLLRTVDQCYAAEPGREVVVGLLDKHLTPQPRLLVDLTIPLTLDLAKIALGDVGCEFARSSLLGIGGGRTERLVRISQHFGCSRYITGPSASEYLDTQAFADEGISVEWENYRLSSSRVDGNASILDWIARHPSDLPPYLA
jgi:hypothetical protein